MKLLESLKQFLESHLKKESTLLLGYSGGGDSKALLYLLLECKKEIDFRLEIAHVDHGWRVESSLEAEEIHKEAERLSLPLHFMRCSRLKKGNYEDVYRKLRRDFFEAVLKKIGAQALLLAHHRDDQTETILKRIFEGSFFSGHLGMAEVSTVLSTSSSSYCSSNLSLTTTTSSSSCFSPSTVAKEPLASTSMSSLSSPSATTNLTRASFEIWRPLLNVPKEDLLNYLKERNIPFFHDSTNDDEQYLRARMRKRLLPYLEKEFGKSISSNLLHLAKFGEMVENYMDGNIGSLLGEAVEGALGFFLDLSKRTLEKAEVVFFLQKLFREKQILLSRENRERISQALIEGKRFFLQLGDRWVVVERKQLFLSLPLSRFAEPVVITEEGIYSCYGWKISVEKSEKDSLLTKGWRSLWEKGSSLLVAEGKYFLAQGSEGQYFKGKRLKKRYQEEKVPYFLRRETPLLFDCKGVAGDFLLSHQPLLDKDLVNIWKITLSK